MGAHVEDDDSQPDRAEQRPGEHVGRVVHAAVHAAAGDQQRHRRADDDGGHLDPPMPAVPEDDRGNRAVEAHGSSGVARGERRGRRRFVEVRDARPRAVDEKRRRHEDGRLSDHRVDDNQGLAPATKLPAEHRRGERREGDDRQRLGQRRDELALRDALLLAVLHQPSGHLGVPPADRRGREHIGEEIPNPTINATRQAAGTRSHRTSRTMRPKPCERMLWGYPRRR